MENGLLRSGHVRPLHESRDTLSGKELNRRSEAGQKHQGSSGEEDDSGLILPMELVEKILARVPFPDVFKTRVLSRSLCRKFSLASKHERPIHCPLLNELSTAAVRWPSFCPVYRSPEGALIGYNHTSQNWEAIVICWYIRLKNIPSNFLGGGEIAFGGSLMCIYEIGFRPSVFEILVANIQSGSWKTILCPLNLENTYDPQVRLICEPGSEDYRVMVYDMERPESDDIVDIEFEIHLFDSTSSTWTSKQSSYAEALGYLSTYCACSHQVHVDGNIYLIMPAYEHTDLEGPSLRLIKYNLLRDVWAESSTTFQGKEHENYEDGGVFLCGAKLMLVTVCREAHFDPVLIVPDTGELVDIRETRRQHSRRRPSGYTYGARAYQICPETLELDLVSVSPSGIFEGVCGSFMSDDNHIYFYCNLESPGKYKASVARFNVSDASWDQLPSPPTDIFRVASMARSAYVPGQNALALA